MRRSLLGILFACIVMPGAVSAFGVDYSYTEYTTLGYDMPSQTLTQTVTVTGYSTGSCTHVCGPNNQQCTDPNCANATHVLTITNTLGAAGGDYTFNLPMFYNLNQSVAVSLYLPVGSPVLSGSQFTAATSRAKILCSFIGSIFFDTGFLSRYIEEAYTRFKYTLTIGPSPSGGVTVAVVTWCNAASTPPDWATSTIANIGTVYPFWDTIATCIRAPTTAPWSCWAPGTILGLPKIAGMDQPLATCTKNP